MQKKIYLILFLVLALVFGGWTVSPAESAPAQWIPEQNTRECKSGADALVGNLAEIPRATNRVRQICEFNVRMDRLDSRISDYDKQFIEQAIASNLLAIQSLEYTLDRVSNEEWRGLITMMIAMHTHDLEMAIDVADELGLETMADLTSVRVYPGTPDYDLGMRTMDLVARFMDPLMNAGGIPTPMPPPAIPTLKDTPTPLAAGVMNNTPTVISTLDLSGTPTVVLTQEITGTPATATPSPALTEDTTETPTAALTEATTGTPATLPTENGTGTPTVIPTLEMTGTTTAIPTDIVTGTATPTAIPTDTGNEPNFDMLALHIIEEQHSMQVQVALVAQRLVTNDEIRAFAKHTADMAQLHLLLMSDLKHRLFDSYVPPTPDFQREYQGPRRFEE